MGKNNSVKKIDEEQILKTEKSKLTDCKRT